MVTRDCFLFYFKEIEQLKLRKRKLDEEETSNYKSVMYWSFEEKSHVKIYMKKNKLAYIFMEQLFALLSIKASK